MSKIILKRNTYKPVKRVTYVDPDNGNVTEFIGDLEFRHHGTVNRRPKSKQIRCLGTSSDGIRTKIKQLAEDGLKDGMWLEGDDATDGHTRLAAIDEGDFDLSEFADGLPFYRLRGTHTEEDIQNFQLAVNKKIDDYQGNDEATIKEVLEDRLITGSKKNATEEEKLAECRRVVWNSVSSRWSTKKKNNFAKEIFNDCVENGIQALARIEGYSVGIVSGVLVSEIERGLHPQFKNFIRKTKDSTTGNESKSFDSGENDGIRSVRLLPESDHANNVGKEMLKWVKNGQRPAQLHWIMWTKSLKAPNILNKRKATEKNIRAAFDQLKEPIDLYIWWMPQILEDIGKIKKEPEGVLIAGYGNPKPYEQPTNYLHE